MSQTNNIQQKNSVTRFRVCQKTMSVALSRHKYLGNTLLASLAFFLSILFICSTLLMPTYSARAEMVDNSEYLKNYLLVWDTQGGIPVPETERIYIDDEIYWFSGDFPEKLGMQIEYWYWINEAGEHIPVEINETKITKEMIKDDIITLYAQWNIAEYDVLLDVYEGEDQGQEHQIVMHGDKVTRPSDPRLYGSEFKGWCSSDNQYDECYEIWDFDTPVTDHLLLWAYWEELMYEVTFDTHGGVPIPPTQTVSSDDLIDQPVDPTKEGHEFVRWYWLDENNARHTYDFSDSPTQNIVLHAEWDGEEIEPAKGFYLIKFDANGGYPVPEAKYLTDGQMLDTPSVAPVKDGHSLIGWYTLGENGEHIPYVFGATRVESSMILYAEWEARVFQIIFYGNNSPDFDENDYPKQYVKYGDLVKKPEKDPVYDTYDFVGWAISYSGVLYDFNAPVDCDYWLYPKWKPHVYTISFDTHGGQPVPEDQYVDSEDAPDEPKFIPVKDGYTFVEWYVIDPDGTQRTFEFNEAPVRDYTIHASWKENPPPAKPEPSEPEPGTPEPGEPEPGTPEPGEPEPGTPEPGEPEPGTPEPGEPEPGTPEPSKPEPGTPAPGKPGTPAPSKPEAPKRPTPTPAPPVARPSWPDVPLPSYPVISTPPNLVQPVPGQNATAVTKTPTKPVQPKKPQTTQPDTFSKRHTTEPRKSELRNSDLGKLGSSSSKPGDAQHSSSANTVVLIAALIGGAALVVAAGLLLMRRKRIRIAAAQAESKQEVKQSNTRKKR